MPVLRTRDPAGGALRGVNLRTRNTGAQDSSELPSPDYGPALEAALVAHYDLESSPSWGDADPGSHDLGQLGTVTSRNGIFAGDEAAEFQGGTSRIRKADAYNTTDSATSVSLWTRQAKPAGAWDGVIYGDGESHTLASQTRAVITTSETNYYPRFLVSDGTNKAEVEDSSSVLYAALPGVGWFHLVGTWDKTLNSGKVTLYVNGAAAGDSATGVTADLNPSVTSDGIGISATHNGISYCSAGVWVDQVSIFDKKLIAAEVAWLYNKGNGRKRPWGDA